MVANPKDLPRHYYTLDEYYSLERTGDARYEYWNGEIVCMSGGSLQHAVISRNLIIHLGRQLEGRKCQAFTADMAIKTPMLPPYRYPDLSVVCDQPFVEKIGGMTTLVNPILIVEVLSPDSESRDQNEKREAYQALSSLQEYLVVAQNLPHIAHYLRMNDKWLRNDYADMAKVIELPSIDCRITLKEVYDGVDLP
ncbi:MAG: Uma2 family endonuclease [Acidobacteria bacterium]|nr:Uma2 family endonuclease [Acidobacteriota bacterium]